MKVSQGGTITLKIGGSPQYTYDVCQEWRVSGARGTRLVSTTAGQFQKKGCRGSGADTMYVQLWLWATSLGLL
ncbi:hypothetical protein Pelo_19815 [Pelomyxa schiedti]|nr:hypothetical protein Pelo_19815 [Pelomyxa schiedti]